MKKTLSDLVRVLSWQFIVLLLIIGLFALGYFLRNDIQITYHKWGEKSALNSMRTLFTSGNNERITKYSEKVQKHRQALIKLGYLERRTFTTQFLISNRSQIEQMSKEYSKMYPASTIRFSIGNKIHITDRPEKMKIWEELVEKYDVPLAEPNQPDLTE